MERRDFLGALAAAPAALGLAGTMPGGAGGGGGAAMGERSTRGDYLAWSAEERDYWFFNAGDGLDRLRRLADRHRAAADFRELARSASGLPVYGFRLGSGPRPVAILSGMHGCEPSGPRGLLAFLDALLGGARPFGRPLDAARLLARLTLHVFPLINPGGAERFALHFPDSWHGTWIPDWNDANATRFYAEGNEPCKFFYGTYVKQAPMRFSPDQIAQWEATGHVIGSSMTDQGLDMWFDWDDTHGTETRALKQILGAVRPYCVLDFHNFMFPTEVFLPTIPSASYQPDETALAAAIHAEWRARRLLFNPRPPRGYPKPPEKYYEDAWFHQIGARCLIVEFNGGMLATAGAEYEPIPGMRALTRRESLESAYAAACALAEALA